MDNFIEDIIGQVVIIVLILIFLGFVVGWFAGTHSANSDWNRCSEHIFNTGPTPYEYPDWFGKLQDCMRADLTN